MSKTAVATFEVAVTYNGVTQEVVANPNQAVQALLQHALNAFGIKEGRENFGLFTREGVEVNLESSVEAAGVDAESQLLLRPRRVSGGA